MPLNLFLYAKVLEDAKKAAQKLFSQVLLLEKIEKISITERTIERKFSSKNLFVRLFSLILMMIHYIKSFKPFCREFKVVLFRVLKGKSQY